MKSFIVLTAFMAASMSSTAFSCNLQEAIELVIAKDGIHPANQSVGAADNTVVVGNDSVVISRVSTISPDGLSCSRIVACHPKTNAYQFLSRGCTN